MKKNLLFLAPLFLFACSKHNNTGSNNNGPVSWLSSVSIYNSGTRLTDSILYDPSHRVAQFGQYQFDTTSGPPKVYSWTATFTLPPDTAAPPTSYVYAGAGVPETHQLSYDGQGRITKDTNLVTSGTVMYFSYFNSNIAVKIFFDGSQQDYQLDTLSLTNGNITTSRIHLPNAAHTADSLESSLILGYGGFGNPGYQSGIALAIGPLLYVLQLNTFGSVWDFTSIRAFNSVEDITYGQSSGPTSSIITYTQTGDSKGRLIQSVPYAGSTVGMITFNYY